MTLPKAVEAQGQRAEALLAAQMAERAAHAKAQDGNTAPPAPAPETPPVAPPTEAPKEPVAPATPPAPPAPPSELESALEAERQKNKVLQGKYNAEVPRLSAALKAEQEARTKLEERNAALEKAKREQPLVSEDEVKEFGEPLVNLARKIAQEESRPLIDKVDRLEAENAALRAQVTQTAQVGAGLNTQAFYSALDAAHPDWRVVNDKPEFLKWLSEVDALAGRSRQDILDEAQDTLDAKRVAAFFTAWKSVIHTRAAPAAAALEAQVVPSSTPGGAPAADPQKRIWTAGEITKFYDDVRRGRISEADAARTELDIQAAQRAGRYRPR